MKRLLLLLLALAPLPALAVPPNPAPLALTLPPAAYACEGVPFSLWFDNIVLTPTPERYRFEVEAPLGTSETRRWTVTPQAAHVGTHALRVRVLDDQQNEIASASTTLVVTAADAGAGQKRRLLIVGDSLTHASLYPNEIARLLSRPGNPRWQMIGTHRPAAAAPGVVHEGYGGWKWQDFLTKFAPAPPGVAAGPLARKTTSPFLFPAADGTHGVLDLPRYFREHSSGQPPDVVLFLLGINDCFGADPERPDARISEVLDHAEKLLAAFRQAAPDAALAVGLTPPPNSRQAAFTANYQDKYTRWGWKRIQHRLVQRLLERFAGHEHEGLFLVPTNLDLDPVDGYPPHNAVHPNATGYAQIGASFYAWLKHWMHRP